MRAPAWKFEWNLNTLVILMGFIGGFMAWGATWNELQNRSSTNSRSIENIDKGLTAVEASMRILDTQELRIKSVEKQASDAAVSMRSLEFTLSGLSGDLKVVKEILQRLEASQERRPSGP